MTDDELTVNLYKHTAHLNVIAKQELIDAERLAVATADIDKGCFHRRRRRHRMSCLGVLNYAAGK